MLKILENKGDFDIFLKSNQDKKILIKFSATWCPPCRVLDKNIKELISELEKQKELKKELFILEVDVDKFPSLAQNSQFNIYSVPTIFLYDRGKLVKKFSGSLSLIQLKELIGI